MPDFTVKDRYDFADLLLVMKRLTAPDGCPWDKAQTHDSIRTNMIEEAYEAVDAITRRDIPNMREELGDVLLQVVFHCDMAERNGEFTLSDVIDELVKKLVFRHPHVFGEVKANDAAEALTSWESAKAVEKNYSTLAEQLARIPSGFPALLKCQKLYKKCKKAGLNLEETILTDKIDGILGAGLNADNAGEFLFAAAALCSEKGADPEVALSDYAEDFRRRAEKADEDGKTDDFAL